MKLYRYLEEKWALLLLNFGLFGISTTTSVARIEGQQRDVSDGVRIHRATGALNGTESRAKALLRHGFVLGGLADNIYLNDVRIIHRQHGYMSCYSTDPYSNAFPGYDWVFEISDLDSFLYNVQAAACGRLGRPVITRPVEYSDEVYDAFDEGIPLVNPFCKLAKYRDEQEFRAFWPTSYPVQRFNVCSLRVLDHIRLLRRP